MDPTYTPITINGIEFLPDNKIPYKNDYVRTAEIIDTPKLWHTIGNVPRGVELTKEIVERAIYRHLILDDLWFITYFVIGIKASNHPFVVQQCRAIENGPRTKTLDVWARFHFKAIDVNEPVPTPDGWKRHGDLLPGDKVFGANGVPVSVVNKTPVFMDADCYRVTFDKGYSVVVSGEHLWAADIHTRERLPGNKRKKRRRTTINTVELMAEVNKAKKVRSRVWPSVPLCAPVVSDEKELPINPYVLGCWLGDGDSRGGRITCGYKDLDIIDNIRLEGITVTEQKTSNENSGSFSLNAWTKGNSMTSVLRKLGLKNNKHIPALYQRASVLQRLSILQGLMDTDGTCDVRGTATFVNINQKLSQDVFELVSGLGLKPSLRKHVMRVNGLPYEFFHISFQSHADGLSVFRLKRKLTRSSIGKKSRSSRHAIVNIEPTDSIPCSCIQVDAPDGQYLIGPQFIPTHNSSLLTIAETIQYHLSNQEHCTCIFSYKKPAAEDFLDSIRKTYEKPIIKFAFPDVVYQRPESEAPSWSLQGGITLRRKNTARKEKTVEASGLVEGMVTGSHFERRIYDDIETDDTKDSTDELDKIFSKFDMSSYLGTGTDVDVERVIGTFYSHGGPLVRIRDKMHADGITPEYTTRIVPGTVDGARDGAPVLMSQERLNSEKTKLHYSAQILCNPTPVEDRKLNPDFLTEIEPELIPRSVLKLLMVDPAGDDKGKGGCDWAIMIVGVDPKPDDLGQSDVYIMQAQIEELKEAEAPDIICRMYLSGGIIQKVAVEKVAQSTTEIHVANALKMRGRRISTDDGSLVILSPAGRPKEARIVNNLAWPLNNGKVFISKAVPLAVRDRIKKEMTLFPYWKKDGVDILAYAWDVIRDLDLTRLYTAGTETRFIRSIPKMKTSVA